MGPITKRIETVLTQNLNPLAMKIEDQSSRHQNHIGAHTEGETHFFISITSNVFIGLNRVEQHRLVFSLLQEEIGNHIHALSLHTDAPSQHEKATAVEKK